MGNHRMVVRGGYGIFYGRTPSITLSTAISTNGIDVQNFVYTPTANPTVFPTTYPHNICGAPPTNGVPPSCAPPVVANAPKPTIFVFQPNYHEPLVQQGSFGVEYELRHDLALNVGYLWVHGERLTRTRDINLNAPTAATIPIAPANGGGTLDYMLFSSTRPVSAFNRIDQFESTASSVYNGLTVSLNKRFSHNLQGMLSYTWGHVIDNGPDATAVVPGTDDSKIVSNQFNPNIDRGNGINDQRHRLVLSSVWMVGNYANNLSSSAARGVLGGWQASFIFNAQSGQPFSAMIGTDLNNDGNFSNDRVSTLGRNSFTTPARITLDPRIARNVRITEKTNLQFIWEAFNAFNRANYVTAKNTFYNVSSSASVCGTGVTRCLFAPTGTNAFAFPSFTADFGQVGNRVMQLAAKFSF